LLPRHSGSLLGRQVVVLAKREPDELLGVQQAGVECGADGGAQVPLCIPADAGHVDLIVYDPVHSVSFATGNEKGFVLVLGEANEPAQVVFGL